MRRSISSNTAEAFIRPLQSDPEIACLFLNKPQTKNAISRRMLQELQECLYTAKFDKGIRTLIVRSTSANAFCSGADLAERRSMSPMDVNKFLADLRTTLGQLEALPMPTIAAIDGPALGGGLELGFACDLRVVGHDVTKIGLPETRLGIIPGAGGTQRAVRLLGLAKAKDLIFTARMLTASEALKWGVADYVSTAPSSGFDRALELARDVAKGAPLALRAAKQAISRAVDLPLESGLDFERASYEVLLGTKDRIEALEAFKEKRVPVFKGE
ncbi:ClpP/crotonase-like domain-containing protein [Pisolithus thermaeus]|nr:ClpP/crotonase-like domain-containing protein [Pisolithus croceorrhizus]KAI6163104.1 ClpP/crotonase-like domain-containing protein [Pisolithus thermaeus]